MAEGVYAPAGGATGRFVKVGRDVQVGRGVAVVLGVDVGVGELASAAPRPGAIAQMMASPTRMASVHKPKTGMELRSKSRFTIIFS